MENPFTDLKSQLNRIEDLLIKALEQKDENPIAEEDQWLDMDEAARYLRMAKPTLYALTSRREIPIYKRTRRIYFKKSELNEWVERGRKKAYQKNV